MEGINTRTIFWLALGILVVAGFRWLRMSWPTSGSVDTAGYSYEMPRLKTYSGSFDLSGREIDRQIMADETAKTIDAKKADVNKDKKQADKKKDAKKVAKKDGKNKQKKFETEVVNTKDDLVDLSEDVAMGGDQAANFVATKKADVAKAKTPANRNGVDNETPEFTANQWRTNLAQNPSAELISQFIAAHQKNMISDQEFYTITFELFRDQSQQREQTAVSILNQDTDANQFTFMALEYSRLNEGRRAALWTLMLNYVQPARFSGLNTALNTKEQAVVPLALQVLTIAVDEQKKKATGATNSPFRGLATATPQSFLIFLGSLNSIARVEGPSAQAARTLLAEIQALLKK
jgi:hypothetical protein